MTLDEALTDLELLKNPLWGKHTKNWMNAVQLGIEALKEYRNLKLTTFLPIGYKLPGETKE